MNVKPTENRVVIKQDNPEKVTSSGFIIPDAAQDKANTGVVVSTGPGRKNKDGVLIPMSIAVNDHVMFTPGTGIKTKVNGEDLLVVKEEDIIAVVTE